MLAPSSTSLDIASDDADENPFTFDITGTISQPCLPITAGTPSVQAPSMCLQRGRGGGLHHQQWRHHHRFHTPGTVKGSAIILADNTIGYLAKEKYGGADSFPYRICNQCGLCSDGTITVDIQNEPRCSHRLPSLSK
ncbi:MAG: hypothetical protein M9954_15390 [Cyclobacteriaceae bacterium]|nr:hypothetical protein [Cyclobacteriaceae bacterium]